MGAFFARPVVKYAALGIAVLALVIGVAWYIRATYTDGKKAGASEVVTKTQTETIIKIDEARKEKAKADETIRSKPIDDIIDGLK